MKFSLAKHKENLESRKRHTERLKEKEERAQADYFLYAQSVSFYEAQIDLAEKEGKEGFDEERYGFTRLLG